MFQVALALDQLFNTLLGGLADETLSARAYRQRHKKRWTIVMKVLDSLFFWQDDHCLNAYVSEVIRAHLPNEYRDWESIGEHFKTRGFQCSTEG